MHLPELRAARTEPARAFGYLQLANDTSAWPEAVEMAGDPKFPLAHLVSARLPAERFEEAIDLVRRRRDDVVKVVLEWA